MDTLKNERHTIGWTEEDNDLDSNKLAVEDLALENVVGCCQSDFHLIETEEAFQALLKGLHS